jgi:riboflavin synthase alpha subunit
MFLYRNELKIDQSISHNGVCLTVVHIEEDTYTVTGHSGNPAKNPTWVC